MITLALATIFDFNTGKIPNWVTIPLIIGGIVALCLYPVSLLELILRIVLCVGLFLVPGKFIGGGDKKLIIGLTLMYSFKVGLLTFAFGNVIAAIYTQIQRRMFYKYEKKLCMAPFFMTAFVPIIFTQQVFLDGVM